MKAKPLIYLALLVAAGCAPVPFNTDALPGPSGPPAPALANWQVAFERNGDIWIANGDGSGQKMLTKNGTAPEWSPNGKKIAFVREGSIVTADANGKNQRVVYKGEKLSEWDQVSISWNRKTGELAFSRPVKDGSGIFYYKDNRSFGQIADLQPGDRGTSFSFSSQTAPEWSPSGKYMSFVRNGDVWICQRTQPGEGWGTKFVWEVTRLAATARFDAPVDRASRANVGADGLTWSADEKTLVYGARRLGGSGIFEIRALSLKSVTPEPVDKGVQKDTLLDEGMFPAYCPDGRTLSYVKQSDEGGWNLVLRAPDGKIRTALKDAWQPAWKPK